MAMKYNSIARIGALMVLVLATLACSMVSNLTATSTPRLPVQTYETAAVPISGFNQPKLQAHPQAKGLSMGDPKALVTVVTYGDFQCPSCQNYVTALEPGIITKYIATGKVLYTFVPFSFIDEFQGAAGKESKHAAEAAYCASDQNKFWEYHDMLYANQQTENSGGFSDANLAGMAQALGVDMTSFNQCYSSHRYQQQVLDDEAASQKAGLDQVPSFIVNGKITPVADLSTAIDAAYKEKGGL